MSQMYENIKPWNPLAGECPHKCKYCSINSFKKRFYATCKKYSSGIRLMSKELNSSLGKNNTWFVCSATDLLAKEVKDTQIQKIIDRCFKFPENKYLFQTKNPKRFKYFEFPPNSLLGTTLESNRDYPNLSKAPCIKDRVEGMLFPSVAQKYFITIEPILDFDLKEFIEIIKKVAPDFIWIGADSKKHNLPEPTRNKLVDLISALKEIVSIKIKPNINRLTSL